MLSESIDWPRLKQIIDDNQTFVLTSHIRPDCDALGSELGMAHLLESLGKSVRIVNGQAAPPVLKFIDPESRIECLSEDVQADELLDADVHMILDTSAWAQLGPMADVIRSTRAKKVLIDHHVGEDELGAERFKNTEAEATGRLVVEVADCMNVKLTEAMAIPLYAAIATDTGWFRFPSTTNITMQVAGRLIEAGADPPAIFRQLYEQETLARVNLRGRILARTQTDVDGRLAHTAALDEDFTAAGALRTDTEDVINATLTIEGVEVAVILVALSDGRFKISFRSRNEFDCSAMAAQFDGGGHKVAAGATVDGPFESAQSRVLDAVRAAMR